MKSALLALLIALGLGVAGCAPSTEQHDPAQQKAKVDAVEPQTSNDEPAQDDAQPSTTTPPATAGSDVCIDYWHEAAAATEVMWNLLEDTLAEGLRFAGPGLVAGVLTEVLPMVADDGSGPCDHLATPLIDALADLAAIDAQYWQMGPEHYQDELDLARREMRTFLLATANMPTQYGTASVHEDMDLVLIRNAINGVMFIQEGMRTADEVETAFAIGGLDTGGSMIATPVSVINVGREMHIGQIDFLWQATSGAQYRPVMVLNEAGSITLSVSALEGDPDVASLSAFFDVRPGDHEGELFATIDGALWANLTDPGSANTFQITEDWRLGDP